ncbi:MAG: hypothetical protein K9N55_00085 [Phycisphaerae bacterium]|nr:hypothetical protein [Phycisphaerae bacterium]
MGMERNKLYPWMFLLCVAGVSSWCVCAQPEVREPRPARAVIITCTQMIDDGLFQSLIRRTQEALDSGADYLIFEISTYGGLVKSGDDISKLMLETQARAHTIAYIKTEAISAGAMISVACQDIIMREHTTLGDCAPIVMGGTLEGVEREKTESFIRAIFQKCAKANDYPEALLKAMVSMKLEVYQVKNTRTDQFEYFDVNDLPTDPNLYDLTGRRVVVKDDELLTVDAETALAYGIARAVVKDQKELLSFIETRDGVTFEDQPQVLEPNWSEQMVRAVNHPAVTGILVTIALLALYMEFSAPGLGLPGLVAVICFVILIGSKYLVGLANWIEIAVFVLGILLLLAEIFLIPGFGIAGIAGILCIVAGVFGMLLRSDVGPIPWPQDALDWQGVKRGLQGLFIGVAGFIVLAILLTRYIPQIGFLSGLILIPKAVTSDLAPQASEANAPGLGIGDIGVVVTQCHPIGRVRFGDELKDCVTQGELVDPDVRVEVVSIHGNRIVVRPMEQTG